MRYLFISLFIYLSLTLSAQEMIIDWSACFGSMESDYPEGLAILPNGNTILTFPIIGENAAYNNYHGSYDIWVIVLDDDGFILNNKCFGGSDIDSSVDIEVGEDYIYIIGYTKSTDGDALSEPIGNELQDIWIIKTDFDLNIIWEKKYGPLGPCWLCSSDKTDSGGLVVITDFFNQGGGNVSQYYGGTDIWAFEIDEDGNILWEKTLGNADENTAGNILSTDHGTTMILGETNYSGGMVDCNCHSSDGITRDIWLVELDNQGEIIWQSCYGGSNWELGLDIQQENDGYTMFNISESNDYDVSGNHNEGFSDYWLVHINNGGEIEWQNCFGGSNHDDARQFFKTNDNGYVLIGGSTSDDGDVSFNHGAVIETSDVWVVVLDSNRNIIWEHSYGSGYNNYPSRNSVAQRGEMDFIIAALSAEGEIGQDDIICTPYPVNENSSNWVFRIYDPTIGTRELKKNELLTYPNPSKNQVFFDIPLLDHPIQIQIMDIYGNTMKQIHTIPLQTQIVWNCSTVASGVYFYQTEITGVVYRGKIIVN